MCPMPVIVYTYRTDKHLEKARLVSLVVHQSYQHQQKSVPGDFCISFHGLELLADLSKSLLSN